MKFDTSMTAIVAAAIGGGIAAIIGGIFSFWNYHLIRRAEERRQIRGLAVQISLENFKIYKASADQHGGSVPPIDSFLIHAVQLVSAIDGFLKTDEQIREHLRRGFAAGDAANKEIDERMKQLREERKKGAV